VGLQDPRSELHQVVWSVELVVLEMGMELVKECRGDLRMVLWTDSEWQILVLIC
jgi:hypothetical protein